MVMNVDSISLTVVRLRVALLGYNFVMGFKLYVLTDCSVVSMVNRDAI